MQDTEYGPDPADIRVFDFDDSTLRDIRDAVEIHDHVVSDRYYVDAKHHLNGAAYNAMQEDNLLGLEEDKLKDIHDILHEVGTLHIAGHEYTNPFMQRLADDFERQMERADTAAEVGPEHVETERY